MLAADVWGCSRKNPTRFRLPLEPEECNSLDASLEGGVLAGGVPKVAGPCNTADTIDREETSLDLEGGGVGGRADSNSSDILRLGNRGYLAIKYDQNKHQQ